MVETEESPGLLSILLAPFNMPMTFGHFILVGLTTLVVLLIL